MQYSNIFRWIWFSLYLKSKKSHLTEVAWTLIVDLDKEKSPKQENIHVSIPLITLGLPCHTNKTSIPNKRTDPNLRFSRRSIHTLSRSMFVRGDQHIDAKYLIFQTSIAFEVIRRMFPFKKNRLLCPPLYVHAVLGALRNDLDQRKESLDREIFCSFLPTPQKVQIRIYPLGRVCLLRCVR